MKTTTKKQIVMFSDGSIISAKTYMKTSSKIKISNKDHKTFLLNKKNKSSEYFVKDVDSFKSKFFKF